MKQKEKVIRKYNPLIIKLAIETQIQMQNKIEIHRVVAGKSKIIIKIVKYYSMYYIRERRKTETRGKGTESRRKERRERERQSTSHGFALPSTRPWLNSTWLFIDHD